MQYTYTAVITEKDGTFYAKVPDVDGCITTAPTLTEAIALITDALNFSAIRNSRMTVTFLSYCSMWNHLHKFDDSIIRDKVDFYPHLLLNNALIYAILGKR